MGASVPLWTTAPPMRGRSLLRPPRPPPRDVLGMHATVFGGKHISDMGSFVLNLNNIMGPALVLLPLLNQQAGWLAPQVLGTAFCVLSAVVSGMLVEAMQRIPGNRGFNERYEFVTLMRHYFGRRGFYLAQVAYNLTMMATNLAQMTITAQVLDQLLRHVLGASYAVIYGVWPPAVASYPVDQPQWSDHAIGSANHVSLGLALAMALCLPLGYMNLEDNMWFQYLSAGTFCMLVAAFVAEFATRMVSDPATPGTLPRHATHATRHACSRFPPRAGHRPVRPRPVARAPHARRHGPPESGHRPRRHPLLPLLHRHRPVLGQREGPGHLGRPGHLDTHRRHGRHQGRLRPRGRLGLPAPHLPPRRGGLPSGRAPPWRQQHPLSHARLRPGKGRLLAPWGVRRVSEGPFAQTHSISCPFACLSFVADHGDAVRGVRLHGPHARPRHPYHLYPHQVHHGVCESTLCT